MKLIFTGYTGICYWWNCSRLLQRIRIPVLESSYSQGAFIGLPVTERLINNKFKHTFTEYCSLAFPKFPKYRSLPTISFSLNQQRKGRIQLAFTAQPRPSVFSHLTGYMPAAISDISPQCNTFKSDGRELVELYFC